MVRNLANMMGDQVDNLASDTSSANLSANRSQIETTAWSGWARGGGGRTPAEQANPSIGPDAQKILDKGSELVSMTIVKIPINPRMVEARFDGFDLGVQLVDVGKNGTFAIGDRIEVAEHPTQKGVYELRSPVPRDRRRPR
jgi:hypothetical protein